MPLLVVWEKQIDRRLEAAQEERTLTVKFSLYLDSKTDMAAREPEPIIVANGSVSVDP